MPYTTLAAILDTLETLTAAELQQVRRKLDTIQSAIEQHAKPDEEKKRYVIEMVSCGKATCTKCAGGVKGHGPYRYEVTFNGTKDVKKYVGKAPYQTVQSKA